MTASRRLNNALPLIHRRRALRANLTPAEVVLWRELQRAQLRGRKFRRQQSIGPYIVDFYCPGERLIVELDGAAHDSERSSAYDESRKQYLSAIGLTVIRLENRHVMENLEGVLVYITQHFRCA
jgi:very-short-patch-repair endonuclease